METCKCCNWHRQRAYAADGLCAYCAGHGLEPCTEHNGLRYLQALIKEVAIIDRSGKDADTDLVLKSMRYAVKLLKRDAKIREKYAPPDRKQD